MGFLKPDAPEPPDPKATAAAQTGTNVTTALANAYLNNVDQITPDGSLTYSTPGTEGFDTKTREQFDTAWHRANNSKDPAIRQNNQQALKNIEARTGYAGGEYQTFTDPSSGAKYRVPKVVATQELSKPQKRINAVQNRAEFNLAKFAADQSGRANDLLSNPVDLNNEEIEGRLYELGSKRLDPRFAEQESALRTRLANQGIVPGSEAYNKEMRLQSEAKNDAYNNLALTGRAQSVQEILAERNQPINEITALLSGSQVSQPQFVNTNQGQIPTTDYAGLVNSNYQQRLANAQQEGAFGQALLGGLFGLGAAGIGAF